MEIFSEEERQEVREASKLKAGSLFNGSESIGYKLLADLIAGEIVINDVSRKSLLRGYSEIKTEYEFWKEEDWLDTSVTRSLIRKFRKIVDNELRARRRQGILK